NWLNGEPNDIDPDDDYNEADHTALIKSDGKWRDRNENNKYFYVMEFPCACANAPIEISGMSPIGIFNGSKYFYNAASVTWNEAQSAAENNGGHLVVINDAAENQFLRNQTETRFWIGLNDFANEGNFVWVNGDPLNYTNWNNDEPNNFNGNEDVAEFLTSGRWNDQRDNQGRPYVIEIPCGTTGGNGGGQAGPPVVDQIRGPANGDNFVIGETEVAYEVTDPCGNLEVCVFTVTVEATPAELTLTECPSDLTLNTLPGAPSVIADWPLPTGTTNCFRGGLETLQLSGPEIGDELTAGTQQVAYGVVDSCGSFQGCVFNVTVVAVPSTIVLESCPGDQNLSSNGNGAVAEWAAPTASSDCYIGGINVTQIEGPASGSIFPEGSTRVVYLLSDDCSNSEICIFFINVDGCPDDDNDGVCNDDDLCEGFDDSLDNDGDGIPDGCDDCD
ncbi:MAG: lectin-like protein, partial [Bacteroidota bacterium]